VSSRPVTGGVDSRLPEFTDDVTGADGVFCAGAASFRGAALEPDAAGRLWSRSHAERKARDNAATRIVVILIQTSKVKVEITLQRKGLT
jgi:hypothetical protein